MRRFVFVLGISLLTVTLNACGSSTSSPGDGGSDGDGGVQECQTDTDCAGELQCAAGRCVECIRDSDCEAGQVCMAGACLSACPEAERCERGGTCCPGDWECIDQVCRAPCDGNRCGHRLELCCENGWLCEAERCLIDCGAYDRCGLSLDSCCTTNQICYGAQCTQPSGACLSQSDCPQGQVCEVDLGLCIDEQVVGDCEYHPPTGVFEPGEEWRWTTSAVEPEFNQIMMAPVVANLSDDNGVGLVNHHDVPDVVFINFHSGGDYNGRGVLRVLSGDGTATHLELTAYEVHPGSCPAVGDLDRDGLPEIVVDKRLSSGSITGTYAFHADGSLYWEAPGTGCATGGPAIANLDADPWPEVITSDSVLTHDGAVLCTFPAGSRVPAAADLDLDGVQEVLSGTGAYRAIPDADGNCQPVWTTDPGGAVALANFDADPNPEIVFPADGNLIMLEHDGSQVWSVPIPIDQPRIQAIYGIADCAGSDHKGCRPGGGPPTVADFDGDGSPEIGLAARWYYLVYELDGSVLWAHRTKDYSSAITGSSVFDFEGDGRAEVVYNDEEFLRIYQGSGTGTDADGDGFNDPAILVEIPNPSGTLLEYPLVVDLDADGRAEILVAANNYAFPGFTGLRSFGDTLDNWVGTRRTWNQHSYHVTNVCDGLDRACPAADNHSGAIPEIERPNWQEDWLNNYRQNVQGEGLFLAPDLVVINLYTVCELDQSLYITFDVMNQGSRMAPRNTPVTLYVDGEAIVTLTTSQRLLPGQFEHFTYSWPLPEDKWQIEFDLLVGADDTGNGQGLYNECEDGGEDNNTAALNDLICGGVD